MRKKRKKRESGDGRNQMVEKEKNIEGFVSWCVGEV